MIEEKYLELIQADVDGELPERQRAELSRYLLANPEARAVRDELKRLTGVLARVSSIEPPADLKDSIVSSVRLPAPKGGSSGSGLPPRMFRYAAAVAGAVLVSALAFQVGLDRRSGLDSSEVVGTMASHAPAADAAPADTINVSLDQVTGQVSLYVSPTARVVEFDLAARQPVDVVVAHDGREEKVGGFGTAGRSGTRHYAMVLDGAGSQGSPIEIRFLAAGAEIHRDTLEATGAH